MIIPEEKDVTPDPDETLQDEYPGADGDRDAEDPEGWEEDIEAYWYEYPVEESLFHRSVKPR